MKAYIKLFTNDLKNKGLSLYDKAVFSSLLTKYQYHNNNEFYTYESYIADELEISESTVKRSIKTLFDTGLININKKYHKQLKQTVNYYTIKLDLEDLNTSTKSLELNTIPEPSDTIEQNNKPMEAVSVAEQANTLTTILDDITNNEISYDKGMQEIKNQIERFDREKDKCDTDKYQMLCAVINDEYKETIEVYFQPYNSIYELGYSRLEELATKSGLTPDDVLDIYKEVKKQVA